MKIAQLFRRAAPLDIDAIEQNITQRVTKDVVAKILQGAEDGTQMPLQRRNHMTAYAMDNPYNYRSPQSPRQHPQALVSIDTLRRLADLYDPLRACINHLKREIAAVPLKVVAREDDDDSRTTKQAIEAATAFLANRGGLGGPGKRRSHFESEIIEDLCVVGAAAINYQFTRGGGIHQVVTIDAATIRPLVDEQGHAPGDGNAAYEQWIMGQIVGHYTREELYYDGIYPVSYSPYFKSPVEYLVNTINSALRADDWNRKWLTDGNAPARLFGAPDDWTPQQIRDFQEYLDAMLSGDTVARQKAKIVPGGFKDLGQTRKDQDFQEFELWLLRRTCAMMGVTPASIGFAGEQYKVSQEGSQQVTTQFGAGVLLDFLNAFYDDLWERMGYPQLVTQRVTAQEEDARERAGRNQILVAAGIKSINEARADEGLDPKEGGDDLLLSSSLKPLQAVIDATTTNEPPADDLPDHQNQRANSDTQDFSSEPAPDETTTGDDRTTSLRRPTTRRSGPAAQEIALRQWERKAINRLKQGRTAVCHFESHALDSELVQRLQEGLRQCVTRAELQELFASCGTVRTED
jgi:phage portal protein BeeE